MRLSETRLRQSRRQYAERRSHLADLEGLAQRLGADARRLRDEIDAAGPSAGTAWALIERYGKLQRSIADLAEQIVAARHALAASEEELSLHERASAHRIARRR